MYKVSVVSFRDLFLKEEYSPKGEEKIDLRVRKDEWVEEHGPGRYCFMDSV